MKKKKEDSIVVVYVRLSKEDAEALDNMANKVRRNRLSMIRWLIAEESIRQSLVDK